MNGILALFTVVPILSASVNNAPKPEQARQEIAELGKALDMFYTDCGRYPTAQEGLTALVYQSGSDCRNWGPDPYIKEVPKDPWDHDYIYESSDPRKYVLQSLGADGRPGGTGDDADISSDPN